MRYQLYATVMLQVVTTNRIVRIDFQWPSFVPLVFLQCAYIEKCKLRDNSFSQRSVIS